MIDFNKEFQLHVGDQVKIDHQDSRRGAVEAIRLISEGRLVEEFRGAPDRVVVTVLMRDGIVNRRGIDVTPISYS
ncbi:MAG TPA: hypothetical protein PK878_00810 [bacterium]|nr:hypothetical protein [Candidatus Omnitrophota bacterium]HOJ58800.1 hypothetical protein [bacterium]HOL92786.1 hypothetical protein [bacterium]HPO98999.1 hypothetical protein [bacterium]HXK93126.1 hypothetical protein [bacterium]